MTKLYKKIIKIFIPLLIITIILTYYCLQEFNLSDELLPVDSSPIPWTLVQDSDASRGGSSSATVQDNTSSLTFNFTLSPEVDYPFASMLIAFDDLDQANSFVNFSRYLTISFSVKCSQENVLSLTFFTFDEKITRSDERISYRMPASYFSCSEEETSIKLDLRKFTIPAWWHKYHKIDASDQSYRLTEVLALSFGNSHQSPKSQFSSVVVSNLLLEGEDWRFIYLLAILSTIIWSGFAAWLFIEYRRILVEKVSEKIKREDPPLLLNKQPLENRKDKAKNRLLLYMAAEYSNPDLSLEIASKDLGMNRNKINSLIKEELGFTFSSYLNKLRLKEASRQLAEKPDSQIAEVANTVGYKHTSYFSKLFKAEFGCTPKVFKHQHESKSDKTHPDSD